MRIGIDGIPLAELKTGVGHYTFELARALSLIAPSNEVEVISPADYLASNLNENGGLPSNLRLVQQRVNPLTRHWWSLGLPTYIRRNRFALFHGTNYDVPFWSSCPTVITVHDISLFNHAETHVAHAVRRARLRLPLMLRVATMIITPSESVRRDTSEHFKINSNKIVAVPEAAREIFRPMPMDQTRDVRLRLGVEDEFLLYVGTIEPRKNLLTLIRAFEDLLRTTELRPQLVIVGKKGWLTDELFKYVDQTDMRERILWTGFVSDEELCALYSSCRAFIYPSLYEGFGLPPLEAMACGAPVITSRVPAILETVGTAARLISPKDTNELALSIKELLTEDNLRQLLSYKGLQRSREFSWGRTAKLTLEVYAEALRRKSLRNS